MRIYPAFTLHVPVIEKDVFFFFGKENRMNFLHYIADKSGVEIPKSELDQDDVWGESWGGGVYVRSKEDITTLVHELYHLTEVLSETMGKLPEEMKARVFEWLYKNVMKRLAKKE